MSVFTQLIGIAQKESATGKGTDRSHLKNLKKVQGMSVRFSGPPKCKIKGIVPSQRFAHSLARQQGLTVKTGVIGTLDFLVVPDWDSAEVNLDEAREKGVRLLSETVFWRMIGIQIG